VRKGYRKERLTRIGKIPATKTELLMMAIRFKIFQRDRSMVLVQRGLAAQPFHGRTVVLINEHSHSAAEMVASFAKENHLATLVGTRTAGEVLVVRISSCPVDMCSACPSPAGTPGMGNA